MDPSTSPLSVSVAADGASSSALAAQSSPAAAEADISGMPFSSSPFSSTPSSSPSPQSLPQPLVESEQVDEKSFKVDNGIGGVVVEDCNAAENNDDDNDIQYNAAHVGSSSASSPSLHIDEVLDNDSENDDDEEREQQDVFNDNNVDVLDPSSGMTWGRISHISTGEIYDVEMGRAAGIGGSRCSGFSGISGGTTLTTTTNSSTATTTATATTFPTQQQQQQQQQQRNRIPLLNIPKRKRYRKHSTESEGSAISATNTDYLTSFSIASGAASIVHKTAKLRPFRLMSSTSSMDDVDCPTIVDESVINNSHNTINTTTNNTGVGMRTRPSAHCYRRYAVGEDVLISNPNNNTDGVNATTFNNAHSKNLVNRYGFPEWDVGMYRTSEQRRGPYLYVLAKVVSVHFGEDAQYYTVRREDTLEYQRADAQYMEPMLNQVGIDAAKIAAKKKWFSYNDEEFTSGAGSATLGVVRGKSDRLRPCLDSMNNCTRTCRKRLGEVYRKVKQQTDACLNGKRPYGISCRFTGVNLLVVCSIWYLLIDSVKLAFLPASTDYSCAIGSAIVWFVLVLELIMEVFIRPSGYYALIHSEKAYLPSTVRYISTFHLISEMISLLFFIPEFSCVFRSNGCRERNRFSLANACLMSLYGPDRLHAFYGLAFITMLRLRIFGIVRHWTNMWINNTFVRVRGENGEWRVERGRGFFSPQNYKIQQRRDAMDEPSRHRQSRMKKGGVIVKHTEDYQVTNATKIGTALLRTNANRILIFIFLVGLLNMFPVVFMPYGGTNQQLHNSAVLLQANNLALNDTSDETCDDLQDTVLSWAKTNLFHNKQLYVLQLQIQPLRCKFQLMPNGTSAGLLGATVCRNSTTITNCNNIFETDCQHFCNRWEQQSDEEHIAYLVNEYGARQSVLFNVTVEDDGTYSLPNGEVESAPFSVHILFNEATSVQISAIYIFAVQLGMTLFVLLGLSVLRHDAGRLVLGPLRRILKIVAFYAKNPLSPPPQQGDGEGMSPPHDAKSNEQLGTFETEQLITAVTKTTDLLRKCWGVAGAGIISSNLASEEGGLTTYFNPTVPGKAVYAVFAFVSIDKFQRHLHALKGDIMILINDIAAVLHEEVYRWGYEDSGQCNKNLGNAFLMVYRIGSVCEVMEKRERAEAVIFSGENTAKSLRRRHQSAAMAQQQLTKPHRMNSIPHRLSRSHVDNLDLSTLPGMRAFTDRALLGLLKTFAGIHREKKILDWNNDFRLGAGVGAMSINLNFGMDAGWAVEGAVGSAYKIDATYLSPHVNMASRMMSATKQYGVYILLSQSVQKLLSQNAQDKLRHIDTVTVKGSSVQQKIFTYDAKPRSDFFLYSKTESQQDLDSDRYTPAIWNVDQDLVAMRSHISEDFMAAFNRGRDEYLAGNWPLAVRLLKSADKIMFQRVIEEGFAGQSFVDDKFQQSVADFNEDDERVSMGDGPSQRIIKYIADMGGEAPRNWKGYRPLNFK